MLKRIAVAATLVLAAAGLAQAERAVVVELYTSQGCSSCPPADALLAQLADRDDVIPLALHVDYWDYIGWKDAFANPAFTERQRGYARAKGKTTIYTPQLVVQGETHVVGTKPMELAEAIRDHARGSDAVAVELSRDGDQVTITAHGAGRLPRGMVVQAVTYTPEATVDIRRGENAGRKLSYTNIVDSWREVGQWSGEGVYRAALRVPRGKPLVVLVQAPGQGPVLGAARLR